MATIYSDPDKETIGFKEMFEGETYLYFSSVFKICNQIVCKWLQFSNMVAEIKTLYVNPRNVLLLKYF